MKAFVITPTLGPIHFNTVKYLLELGKDKRCGSIMFPSYQPVEQGMNIAVLDFLKTDATHFIIIENDNFPYCKSEKDNILDLMGLDKDIVGCPYPLVKEGTAYLSALDIQMEGNEMRGFRPEKREGLTEVDCVCTGAIVIDRKVLQALPRPFMQRWTPEGRVLLSHDYNFCLRAKDKGFKVYAHYDYLFDHHKAMSMLFVMPSLIDNKPPSVDSERCLSSPKKNGPDVD